jgi:hypothetical protein
MMDKELLEYLRALALEMSALAEEGNFASLSRLFAMAALEAGQLLGPTIVFSQELPQEAPQMMRHEAPPDRRPRSRQRDRENNELAGTRGIRRSRKHPLHVTT